MRVYDRPIQGVFDESTPALPKGLDSSADAKLEGERIALARGAQYGVPVVVIQPGIVYGPNAHYTLEMLSDLQTGRVMLVNGGVGICNLIYVDDAVTALLLAATNDRAYGERFLISGPEHPTWAQFVGAFEAMLGVHRTVSLSEHDALRLWHRSACSGSLVAEALRAMQGALRTSLSAQDHSETHDELPVKGVGPWVVKNRVREARVSIEKARRILGYTPVVTFSRGMQLTEQWARSTGLIPPGRADEVRASQTDDTASSTQNLAAWSPP
jgi:nucleoside-diphosphate-sugar epimerase